MKFTIYIYRYIIAHKTGRPNFMVQMILVIIIY